MSEQCTKQQPLVLYDAVRSLAEQDCACAGDELAPLALHSGALLEADIDCACAEVITSPEEASVHGAWRRASDLYHVPLHHDYEAIFNPSRPSGVAVLNGPATHILHAFRGPRSLRDESSRQMAAAGLLVPADTPEETRCPSENPGTLTAWLHVTNACDLRCAYCYVRKDASAMDEATGLAAVEAIFRSARRHGFHTVKMKYAGGEPMLNFALVCRLHQHASAQAEWHGLALRETLITNGVHLWDDALAFVAESGIRLAISLGICPQAHDDQRASTDGSETYERVRRSIQRAVHRGIKPHLSITVTGAGKEISAEAVRFALEMGLPFNLNFVRPPDRRLPRARIAAVTRSVQRAFAEIEANLPIHSLLGVLDRAYFGQPHRHACGAGRSYLVVDHLGRISPCQMGMDHWVGDVHSPDPLLLVRTAFANPPVDERAPCAACVWRNVCGGGCPLLAKQRADGHLGTSPYCAAYQALYPDLIRLEGLRILRIRGLC